MARCPLASSTTRATFASRVRGTCPSHSSPNPSWAFDAPPRHAAARAVPPLCVCLSSALSRVRLPCSSPPRIPVFLSSSSTHARHVTLCLRDALASPSSPQAPLNSSTFHSSSPLSHLFRCRECRPRVPPVGRQVGEMPVDKEGSHGRGPRRDVRRVGNALRVGERGRDRAAVPVTAPRAPPAANLACGAVEGGHACRSAAERLPWRERCAALRRCGRSA